MAQVTSDRMRCSGFVGKAKRHLRGCRGADALKFALVCDAHREFYEISSGSGHPVGGELTVQLGRQNPAKYNKSP
jgi:hypothetical protein